MLPNTIRNQTLADADEVQENFEYLDTKSFMHAKGSGTQSVSNGTVINFNVNAGSRGHLSLSGGGVQIKAGHTYKMTAWVNISSATLDKYLGYAFYAGSTFIGGGSYVSQVDATAQFGFKSPSVRFYTPSSDVIIYVKVTDDRIGTGVVNFAYNASFIVEEI